MNPMTGLGRGATQSSPPPYDVLPTLLTTLVLSVVPRASLLTRLSALVAIAAAAVAGTHFRTDSTFFNYLSGTSLGVSIFLAAHLLVFSDPVKECRHESQPPKEAVADMPWWRRLYWMVCLLLSHRAVGWSCEIPNIPPRPQHGRARFVLSRITRVAVHALLMDACFTYMELDPIASAPVSAAEALRRARPWLYVLSCTVCITRFYCHFNVVYDAFAAVVVALGLSEPRHWPTMFGRWRDAYTVRRFWGRVWHQNFRRFASSIGRAAARALGCAPGSWSSSHVQLFVAFAVSGACHVLGDLKVDSTLAHTTFPFFISQAVAMTVEDAVIALGTGVRVRETPFLRFLGYVWTLAWCIGSNPLLCGPQVLLGGADRWIPGSVVRPIWEYLVAPASAGSR